MALMHYTGKRVPVEVVHAAISRSGTSTMARAYDILGIPNVYHGMRFITHTGDGAFWERAADWKFYGKGKPFTRQDWDDFLFQFGAVTDVGGWAMWQELSEAYPEAKIVIVQRDVEKWYKSVDETIFSPMFSPIANFIVNFIEPTVGPRTASAGRKLFLGFFGAKDLVEMRQLAKQKYLDHYDEIRKTIPPERLLDYELGSGWEPLCEFLGKPVPEVDFPWLNEAEEVKKLLTSNRGRILRGGLMKIAVYFIGPAIAVGLALKYYAAR